MLWQLGMCKMKLIYYFSENHDIQLRAVDIKRKII